MQHQFFMDIAFHLHEGQRHSFLQSVMHSYGCTYICLWSYLPQPSKSLSLFSLCFKVVAFSFFGSFFDVFGSLGLQLLEVLGWVLAGDSSGANLFQFGAVAFWGIQAIRFQCGRWVIGLYNLCLIVLVFLQCCNKWVCFILLDLFQDVPINTMFLVSNWRTPSFKPLLLLMCRDSFMS